LATVNRIDTLYALVEDSASAGITARDTKQRALALRQSDGSVQTASNGCLDDHGGHGQSA
jgi:hypothetical protein